jgi:predicted phage tail protein
MASNEAPNNLISNTRLTFLDLLSEGTIGGFWPVSGVSGNSPLCSTYFDAVPLMNGDGSVNYNLSGQGFGFDFRSGTADQFAISGFDKPETFIPLPSNTRVYNPPSGAGSYRAVIAVFNSTQYPDPEAVKVTVRVPALYSVAESTDDDDNPIQTINRFNITYVIEISTDGSNWTTLIYERIDGKCTSDYFRTSVCPLPKTPARPFNEWKVRVRRTSQNILSSQVPNELYVHAVAVVSASTYRYPMSALAGIQITADQFGGIMTSRASRWRFHRATPPPNTIWWTFPVSVTSPSMTGISG